MSKDSGKIVAMTSDDTAMIVVQVVLPVTPGVEDATNRHSDQLEAIQPASAELATKEAMLESAIAPPALDAPFPTPAKRVEGIEGIARPPVHGSSAHPTAHAAPGSRLSANQTSVGGGVPELYQPVTPPQTRLPLSFRRLKAPAKPGKAPLPPDLLVAQAIAKTDREVLADAELFKLFQQRLGLTTNLGLLLLPFFTLIFAYLSPTTRSSILISEGCLFLLCLVARFLAARVPTLLGIRLLTLAAYALFSMGSAAVVAQMSEDPVLGHNQIIAYAGHHQIMLSTLLLPFSLWESLAVMLIATVSLGWATWWTMQSGQSDFYLSQLFVIETTALFVACIAHFQDNLRRQAFNATFDLARHAAQSQQLSTVDPVTGGSNRRHLETMLTQEIARAARFTHPLSVIMFDLDNFKQVNDTLGHRAGDEVLRQVWTIATSTVREIDSLARYGGDEFTVVLPETGETDARAVAERLLANAQAELKRHFGAQHPASRVTLSIGLVTFQLQHPVACESVLEQVDQRLYAAKRQGKNQIVAGVSG